MTIDLTPEDVALIKRALLDLQARYVRASATATDYGVARDHEHTADACGALIHDLGEIK